MPFKSISRHQPSQREPKLSWPSLTGKSLRDCRYHQNKTPQRSLLPKQQQSSNPRQQKAPRPLDVAGTGSQIRPCQWSSVSSTGLGMPQLGSRGGGPKEDAPHHPPTQIHICARGVRPPTQKNRLGCWVGVTTHLQRHVYENFFWYFLFILYFFLCIFHNKEYGAIVLFT